MKVLQNRTFQIREKPSNPKIFKLFPKNVFDFFKTKDLYCILRNPSSKDSLAEKKNQFNFLIYLKVRLIQYAWFLFEGIVSNLNTSLISHLTRKIRSGCPVGFPQKTSASRFIRNCTKRYPKIFPDKSLMVGLKSVPKYKFQRKILSSVTIQIFDVSFPQNQNVTGYFSKIYSLKTFIEHLSLFLEFVSLQNLILYWVMLRRNFHRKRPYITLRAWLAIFFKKSMI